MLRDIRDTTATTGLQVTTSLVEGVYQTSKRVADAVMKTPCMEHYAVYPHGILRFAHAQMAGLLPEASTKSRFIFYRP